MDGRQEGGIETLQEHRAPFTEPDPAKSWWVGNEGQDRPRHNHCFVLAAPSTRAHTHTHMQPYANPKHTPSSHPHTYTHMQIHICITLDIYLSVF